MNKTQNIPEIPLCINVIRLQHYLLLPDEVILFDWLVVKQIAFKYHEFHYSQARIEKETRIKRTRQEVILTKFSSLGFLDIQVHDNKEVKGRVRYFNVWFDVLEDKEILCKIIDEKSIIYSGFMKFMKYHAAEQKKKPQKTKKESYYCDFDDPKHLYNKLNMYYDSRRRLYNDGELTSKKPTRLKPETKLQLNKIIHKKLMALSDNYDEQAIINSFTAYTDAVFTGDVAPNNFMNYFLSYDHTEGAFNVFEHYLNKFNANYCYKNKS